MWTHIWFFLLQSCIIIKKTILVFPVLEPAFNRGSCERISLKKFNIICLWRLLVCFNCLNLQATEFQYDREYEYGLFTDPVLHVILYREWWVHMSNEMTGLPLSKGYRTLFASLGDLIKEWPKWLRVESQWPVQLMGSRRWPENLRFVRLFVFHITILDSWIVS